MMTPDRIRALVDNGYASQDEIDWMLDRALTEKDSPQKSQNYFRIIHQLANAPATEDMPGYVNPKKEGFDALYNEKTGQFNSGGYVIDHQTGKKTIIRGQPQQQRQDVDYSRPQMEIAGYGKGYYSKDGREVIGDGWVASLGRNVAQERQRKMEDLKMQEAQGAIRYNDLRSKKMENELNAPYAEPDRKMMLTEVVDPKEPTRMLRVDASVYRGGTLGDMGVMGVSGKEPTAAKREEKNADGREQLAAQLDGLRANYGFLKDEGGIVSKNAGTLPNVAASLRSSTPGQFVGGVVGTPEQSARNEIGSSRMRLLSAIMAATGQSAKQLDSNTELKMWLDSLGSAKGDYESNMAILQNIEDTFLNGKGKARQGAPMSDSRQGGRMPMAIGSVTPDDIRATAKKYGISEAEVRRKLGM